MTIISNQNNKKLMIIKEALENRKSLLIKQKSVFYFKKCTKKSIIHSKKSTISEDS